MNGPTRGERNHNPLNINYIAPPQMPFLGQVGVEVVPAGETYHPRFGLYSSDLLGIRAGAKELISYITRDGCNTVTKIIDRWAPPSDDNPTTAYVDNVCKSTGFSPTETLAPDAADLAPLIRAMICQENGRCLYPDPLITQAVALALT